TQMTSHGTIVGYIILRKIQTEGYIVNFAVKENYRRQGIGKKLLEHIIQFARTKEINQLFLEVRAKNLPAINLYTKFGFEICQFRPKRYTTDDGFLMRCGLSQTD
ncbi:MAG: ribosomal protein S18-alanine N-acetyltransferase, partial [Elusimicrobiota bacterium]|nr:ribosomal protein S18-alanine N-acetyltransferase [Elusimicrobiota bacterium]